MLNKIIIYFLLLLSFPLVGKCDWTKLFKGNGIEFFFDFDSLKYNNNHRVVLMMINYKDVTSQGDLSQIVKRKINCNEMMYKDLETNFFKLNFGKGEKSRGSGQVENPKWKYFPPGSSGGEIIKVICRIKQSK
tara:strand:- start:16 stop:414 length:399 start_codon:yes stop_codon:yes gene_type:complete